MINETSLEKWISWTWEDDFKGLDEASERHVWDLMKQGYTSGELNRVNENDEDVRGWWNKIESEKKKEFKVFVLNCDNNFDFRTAEYAGDFEGIMTEANKRDSAYSLEYFQDEINDEELNLSNSFILIREV